MHTVYLLWCEVTQKLYIGQTNALASRLRAHRWLSASGKGHMIHRAIQKYGIDSFYWGILAEELTKDEANAVEIAMIAKYQALVPAGYNLRRGGAGIPGISKERKQEITKQLWQNAEWAQRQSISHRGKKQADEIIQKRAIGHYKKIKCMEQNLEFNSSKAAKAWLRAQNKTGSPAAAANGTQKTAGGFTWMYV